MCPACLTATALMFAGATSTGGLTALVVKMLRVKNRANGTKSTTETKGDRDGSFKSCIAR